MNFSKISFGLFSVEFIGLAYALSFCVVAWLWYKTIAHRNFSVDYFVHHFWKWFFAAVFVGRIVALILHPGVFSEYGPAGVFAFWEGGLNAIGMLFGFTGMMYLDFKSTEFHLFRWLDTLTSPLIVGVMIMDVSFFLTGAIYGIPTNLFWGIRYETFGVELITPVHPVTIYALILHIILFVWIRKNANRLRERFGILFLQTLWWLFFINFLASFLRADPNLYLFGIMRFEQILSLLALIALSIFTKKVKAKTKI